jgi:PKD repeat protein
MKSSYFAFLAALLCNLSLSSQSASISVTLTDLNSNPINGAAIFFIPKHIQGINAQYLKMVDVIPAYTNSAGIAAYPLGNLQVGDSIMAFTKDCNNNYRTAYFVHGLTSQNDTISVFCPPTSCQAHLKFTLQNGFVSTQAYALRDSAAVTIPGNRVRHSFTFNGQNFVQPSMGNPNYDSIAIPLTSLISRILNACYARTDSACSQSCDTIPVAPPLSCNTFLHIDTANSNFVQRTILFRPSMNGYSTTYTIDFGDGNSITTSADSIVHTYAADGTYQICHTSTTIRASFNDTCIATRCYSFTLPFNPLSCKAAFYIDTWKTDINARQIHFTVNPNYSGASTVSYSWDFGDGQQLNNSTSRDAFHQYATDSNYNVCLTITTTGSGYTCVDTKCHTIAVSPNTWPLQCDSRFSIDSDTTQPGQITIFEGSRVNLGASISSWFWDFGDGNTASTRLPTHTYAPVAATYILCLTTVSVNHGDTCMSTYCDTIGFDANGNSVFKEGMAFTINVQDPGNISLEEVQKSDFNLYPNPSQGEVTLSWEDHIRVNNLSVYTLGGRKVKEIFAPNSNLELKGLASGTYIILLNTDKKPITLKLMVK